MKKLFFSWIFFFLFISLLSPRITSGEEIKLPQQPISLHFQDTDIREIFRVFALKSGINIIYGDDVKGTLTIHLDNVPFDQALNTVLTLKGFAYQVVGTNILRIVSPEILSAERAKAVTYTKIYPLNYAKAEEIKTQLDAIRTAEGRKGTISVDTRTNSLIVTDIREGLEAAEKLIKELDKKPQQVMIEAKVIEVSLGKEFELGVEWSYASTKKPGSSTDILGVGKTKEEISPIGIGVEGEIDKKVKNPLTMGEEGTGVSLPRTLGGAGGGSISFGIITDTSRLLAMISALATKEQAKVLASPKVATLNNKEARILIGGKVPYTKSEVTAAGVAEKSIEFFEIGIKLTVTPTINAEKRITLKVRPEVTGVQKTGQGLGTTIRETETTVLVGDGETMVIGGLIEERDSEVIERVPGLGDIPVIGEFFKHRYQEKTRSELLVFLTPRIIED